MEKEQSSKNYSTALIIFVLASVLLVIFSSYTRYLFAKDYFFFVEAPCDEETQTCFFRRCDDYCPPNQLEVYSVYRIKASLYEQCTDNSCENICNDSASKSTCELIPCNVDDGVECSEGLKL